MSGIWQDFFLHTALKHNTMEKHPFDIHVKYQAGPPEGSKYWGGNAKSYIFWSIFIWFSKTFFPLKAVDGANYWGGGKLPPQFRRPCQGLWIVNFCLSDDFPGSFDEYCQRLQSSLILKMLHIKPEL